MYRIKFIDSDGMQHISGMVTAIALELVVRMIELRAKSLEIEFIPQR